MQWQFAPSATLAFAALVLMIGRLIVGKVKILQEYSIPAPVVGGLFPALIIALLQIFGLEFTFDLSMQPGLLLAFFATVGLSADLRMIIRGGKAFLIFLGIVVVMMIFQNVVGVGLSMAMGINPLIGLTVGSISLAGGHGTAAAWGEKFSESFGLVGATGIGLAASTFGLVLGGLLGGPIGERLVGKLRRRNQELGTKREPGLHDKAEAQAGFTPERLIASIFLIATCVALGNWLVRLTENPVVTIPDFVWTLFIGVVLRNLFSRVRLREIDSHALDFAGEVALSLFLAMALMSLRLWELLSLAGPMFVILIAQSVLMWIIVIRITFPLMGSNYDAVLMSAGQTGFGLGGTATAMINMDALTKRYGWSPRAFLFVPIVGSFMVSMFNAIIVSGFVQFLAVLR